MEAPITSQLSFQVVDVRLSEAVKHRDDTVLVEVRQWGPPMGESPAGPDTDVQRDQEQASTTCAACTWAALHQDVTLPVQVTCH